MIYPKIEDMVGMTFTSVTADGDEMAFMGNGRSFRFHYEPDCCAHAAIHDIVGDLKDLEGSPILQAEEETNHDPVPNVGWQPESHTWTFYKFATIKGYVTVSWLGESNGYYNESVTFSEITKGPK
jgi:hypothetical protein